MTKWKVLQQAVLHQSEPVKDPSNDYFTTSILTTNSHIEILFEGSSLISILLPHKSLNLKQMETKYSGFYNTGSYLWPAEQVMARWVIQNIHLFAGKSVLELGSGCTALAGLFLAKTVLSDSDGITGPSSLILSDGNPDTVNILTLNIQRNQVQATAMVLDWDSPPSLNSDYILVSDCTYHTESHHALLTCLDATLKVDGTVYIFGPSRGGSLELFALLAQSHGWTTSLSIDFDESISNLQKAQSGRSHYCQDKDFIRLLSLTR